MNCSSCQTAISQEVKFCPNCGNLVADSCSVCGNKLSTNDKFCPNCGTASSHSLSGSGISHSEQTGLSNLSRDLSNVSQDAKNLRIPTVELSIGDIIDNQYKIEKKLGQGGYGGVYLVEDLLAERTMAVKVIPYIDKSSAKNILLEFETRNQIQEYEYIAKGYQPQTKVYEGQDIVVYPMELADMSLRDWMLENKGKHGEKLNEGLEYFRQACMGMTAIHKAGLLHLDIKPENILLVKDRSKEGKYKVKITDFGLARGFGTEHLEILQDGAGTALYMAPEQIQAARWKDIGKPADIYSMGLLLYEIIDGSPPYSGSPQQIKQKKQQDIKPGKLKGENAKWWNIIERAINLDTDERYSIIDELLRDFERLLLGTTTSADVSCKKCNHMNPDPSLRYCEKCNSDLSDIFDACTRCAKMVRIDTDICPGCGWNVGAERLYYVRLERLDVLKDEDPVEAISMLEELIKSNFKPDDKAEKERNLTKDIKELRQKQNIISDLMKEATAPSLMAKPEEAMRKWEEVLKIIPRHRIAKKRIAELREVIEGTGKLFNKSNSLASQAKFDEARKVLEKGLETNKVKEPIREAIKKLDIDEKAYYAAMSSFMHHKEGKQLLEALNELNKALKIAPESPEALSSKDEVQKVIDNNKKLVTEIIKSIARADFENAEKCLKMIIDSQSDNKEYENLLKEARKAQADFPPVFNNAAELYDKKQLKDALPEIKKALKVCPDSSDAKTLLKNIENDISKAENYYKTAQSKLAEAEFQQARQNISKAINLWSNNSAINSFEQKISNTESKYTSAIESANANLKKRQFSIAVHDAKEAIKICPDSTEAKALKNKIENEWSVYERKKQEQANMLKESALWALILIPGIIATLYFLFGNLDMDLWGMNIPGIVGKLVIGVPIIYSIIYHMNSKTDFYYRLRRNSWIAFSDTKVFFSLLSIIAFPLMIAALIGNAFLALIVFVVYHLILINVD